MPEDHLLAEPVDDVSDVVTPLFFRDFAVEDNVQQHVAEFLFQVVVIVLEDGIAQFINLLDGHRTEGIDGLGMVPGTFGPEFVHDIEDAPELREFFFLGMHLAMGLGSKFT